MEPRYDHAAVDPAQNNFGAAAGSLASASPASYIYPPHYSRHGSYSEGVGFDSVWGFIHDVAANQPLLPPPAQYPNQGKYSNALFPPFSSTSAYRASPYSGLLNPGDSGASASSYDAINRPRTPEYGMQSRMDDGRGSDRSGWRSGGYTEEAYRHGMMVEHSELQKGPVSPHWSPPQQPYHSHEAAPYAAPHFDNAPRSPAPAVANSGLAWANHAHDHYRDPYAAPSAATSENSPNSSPSTLASSSGRKNAWASESGWARTKLKLPVASPEQYGSPIDTDDLPEPPQNAAIPPFIDERDVDQGKLRTLFRVDLGGYAIPQGLSKSLSRPVFAPRADSRRYMLGAVASEEFTEGLRDKNQLIFFQFDHRRIREVPSVVDSQTFNVPVIWKYSLSDGVRDILWADDTHIFLALGDRITMVQLGADLNVSEACDFPTFHSDDIREMALRDMHLLLSGGFDGNVFITDVVKLTDSIRRNDTAGRNRVYRCGATVGSVAWHPTEQALASCTTDTGTVKIFDTRTEKHSPAISMNTGESELYCHSYRDTVTMLLGYGSGKMRAWDYRMNKNVFVFEDTGLNAIGEIKWDFNTGMFACFGQAKVSAWQWTRQSISLWAEAPLGLDNIPDGKTSGNFIRNTNLMGVTTSEGSFALMDYTSRLDDD